MKLNNIKLYKKLKDNGVSYLYHADTLTTSMSCILNGGLFSRGGMEKKSLHMTPQTSDLIDKNFNVWNDIFLDTVDLHGYKYSGYSRQNLYGPVLFILKLELLLDPKFDNIWITKNNPINWSKCNDQGKRYFDSVDDYIENIDKNRQQKMITIRNIDISIPFNKYLTRIELDDPQRYIDNLKISAYKYAYNNLNDAITKTNLNVNIVKHMCNKCYCIKNYKSMDEREFNKYFKLI